MFMVLTYNLILECLEELVRFFVLNEINNSIFSAFKLQFDVVNLGKCFANSFNQRLVILKEL